MDVSDQYIYGKKINNISEIYKGDGITTCKWCGNTGWMRTFSISGYFYSDAPCGCCDIGKKILMDNIRKEI